MVFRGNLQHGVSGALSRWADGGTLAPSDGLGRRTLLVNWWRERPLAPNCAAFSEERWRRLQMWREPTELEAWIGSHPSPSPPAPLTWAAVRADGGSSRRVAVMIPPTDLMYFNFPAAAEMPAAQNWRLDWTFSTSLGPITKLDLEHQSSTSNLFKDERPKLFIVLPASGSDHWAARLPQWLPQLYHAYSRRLRFVLADPATSHDFLNVVRLKPTDAPTVVLHHPKLGDDPNAIRRLGKPMTGKAVRTFVHGYVKDVLDVEHKTEL